MAVTCCSLPAPTQQWQLLRPRPCWGLPSTRWESGPAGLGTGLALPRVQSQRQTDSPVQLGTPWGLQVLCCHLPEGFYCAGISQRSFAMLALPSMAQERCESPTSPCLPPLPASKGHSAGPQQKRFERAHKVPFTSILSTPLGFLHGLDHMEAASCFSPACSSWSAKHQRCAQELRARLQQTCCHHPQ